MTGVQVNRSGASRVPSSNIPSPGIQRGFAGANPVNAPGHRETASLSPNATPRMMHPDINRESWAKSYAEYRTEPSRARGTQRRNSNRRMKSIRKKEGRR